MESMIGMKPAARGEVFENTAAKMKMHTAMAEKDYWVCIVLRYLFQESPWKQAISFKGGTSLSKAFNLIQRFSEDIDLILDWRLLGYGKDEPWEERSNTQQDLFNKSANAKAAEFLRESFCPKLKEDLSEKLGAVANVHVDPDDPNTVVFTYPAMYSLPAILPYIRLECGPLAAWTPAKIMPITPYVAEIYPRLFKHPSADVLTVLPERTFWEKTTILHQEAHRAEISLMPERYSRHYYDIYRMSRTHVKKDAFMNTDLLDKVVTFKRKFYPRKWAHDEKATLTGLRLVPPAYRLPQLAGDYSRMRDMLYGTVPNMHEIMEGITVLEREIHELGSSNVS